MLCVLTTKQILHRQIECRSHNLRFGATAGVPHWIVLKNSKLSGFWQAQVARHLVKLPDVSLHAGRQFVYEDLQSLAALPVWFPILNRFFIFS